VLKFLVNFSIILTGRRHTTKHDELNGRSDWAEPYI
jgi:hypothetical protein